MKEVTAKDENVINHPKSRIFQHREQRIDLPSSLNCVAVSKSFEDREYQLINCSMFGAQLVGPKCDDHYVSSLIESVTLMIEGAIVYSGPTVVVNVREQDERHVVLGLSLIGDPIDLNRVDAIVQSDSFYDEIKKTKSTLKIAELVDPNFKICIADLNTLFQDLKELLLIEEKRIDDLDCQAEKKLRLKEQVVTLAHSLYSQDFHNLFEKFREITNKFSREEHLIHKRYFRSNFLSIILGTPFTNRAFKKPLGYAGDFGLMTMFYEYDDSGADLFFKFFHRLACNEPAALANKNRVYYLSEEFGKIADGFDRLKISNIACGPAKEIELFIASNESIKNKEIELILIDQETRALDWANQRIKKIAPRSTKIKKYAEDAVLGLLRNKDYAMEIDGSNIIVSAGLFDYLSDKLASRLIWNLVERLSPGGHLIIGNVSPRNPDVFTMSYFMEWELILRDENALKALIPEELKQKHNLNVSVHSEDLGINLFLHVTKE
ncbi:MAG: hypothetical protein KDD25_00150 [Bdellovibrionales bacterium]|nr:hypothetical protein [Bdellovibrionales bacterium]